MMIATPRPKKPNMAIGTHLELDLYDGGTGGVYRELDDVVVRPLLEDLLTRLRFLFVWSATPLRIGATRAA